jgi:hypothetical protein
LGEGSNADRSKPKLINKSQEQVVHVVAIPSQILFKSPLAKLTFSKSLAQFSFPNFYGFVPRDFTLLLVVFGLGTWLLFEKLY